MSKKHFVALAAALAAEKPVCNPALLLQWRADVDAATSVCAKFNPNFDRARFLKACGVEEGK